MFRQIFAIALCFVASPVLAEALTYKGSIGTAPVIVEFSAEPHVAKTDLFARYAYVKQGIDIPLHAQPDGRHLNLVEEVACDRDLGNCPHADDDIPTDPPLGARWQLDIVDDGMTIEGTFALEGKTLPVRLERVRSRPFDPATGHAGLAGLGTGMSWVNLVISSRTAPYEFLKLTGLPLQRSAPVEGDGASYEYVVDLRTKFQFPRILDLSGYDIVPANSWLEQRHFMMSLDALWCAAQRYQGFGTFGYNWAAGTLGWWDEEQIEVHYLSAEVMSWTEGGSLDCGGAHPYNHYEFYNLDTVHGTPLDLSRIFRGWVPTTFSGEPVDLETARANPGDYRWGPDRELYDFVQRHRISDADLGVTGGEDDCPMDELVRTNLAIGFKPGDIVRFALDGLPHAEQACGGDLYDVPLIEIVHLLEPGAEDYFPSLAD